MAMLVITRGYLFSLAQNIAFFFAPQKPRSGCSRLHIQRCRAAGMSSGLTWKLRWKLLETIGKSKHEPRNVQIWMIWTLKWSKSNVRSSRATCEKWTTASVPWQSHAQKVAGPHESRQGIIPAPGYKIRKIQ